MDIKNPIPTDKFYEDAISPAMKQIGKSLESIAKTSRYLLAPFTFLAAQHDRWENRLKKVAERIPEENLVEGRPEIVIPALEGLSIYEENSMLEELFINLLCNSLDKTKQELAHPAFSSIIKQLSYDEAVILFYLKKQDYKHIAQSDWNDSEHKFENYRTIQEDFPIHKLIFPGNIDVYNNHLSGLTLAGNFQKGEQEMIWDAQGLQTGVYIYSVRMLTDFGRLFAKACIPDNFSDL